MTRGAGFDRVLEAWLESAAPTRPAGLHADVIEQVRATHQRPRWLAALHAASLGPAGPGIRPVVRYSAVLLALVLAALMLALAVVGSRPRVPPPFGPAANGSFLYERDGDIYAAGPGDAAERALIVGPTDDFEPRWSRDGTKFVFLRETSPTGPQDILMVANADGSGIRPLGSQPLSAPDWVDWSPDGKQLVVHHVIDGRGVISILTDDRRPMRTLELGPIEPWGFVAWQPPLGEELIFVGHPGAVQTDLAVFGVRPDGSGIHPIAVKHDESAGRPGSDPNPKQYSYQGMVLSDDGSDAAFWNWEPTVVAGRETAVHVLDLASGEDRRMAYDQGSGGEVSPALSPDGTKLAFETGYTATPDNAQVMVAPVDGSSRARAVGPVFPWQTKHAFTFSPDGTKIILYLDGEPTKLIDVTTGAVQEAPQALPWIPSWQRRAR